MNKIKYTYRQIQKFNKSVLHNFEVSVLMAFYKKLEAFKKGLPQNAKYFQRNGIEVILVMDEPSGKEGLLECIKTYPFINWKVIVNEQEHLPRNPAPVLNVGIRHATKKYIMVSYPEVEFHTDVIFQLRNLLEHYPDHYTTGTAALVENVDDLYERNIGSLSFVNYGSLMAEKHVLEQIGGFNEQFQRKGGEDDNLRRRLDLSRVKLLKVPEAKSLHREENLAIKQSSVKTDSFSAKELKYVYYPAKAKVNGKLWGTEFNKLVYDWQNNAFAVELCHEYLGSFVQYEIRDSSVFTKKYKKLILCQAYNESEFMTGFLEDMAKYFDGIILLDDGSTDPTWELAKHVKLLLKVKKIRKEFNDLENRNILLNIASFFKSHWLCFMDIDERFDERYVDFGVFEDDKNKDTIAFKAVYLWDSDQTYYKNIPNSKQGILKVFRMFRPLGRMQINTRKHKLHFAQTPYFQKISFENILVKDSGILKQKSRMNKYKRYLEEDTKGDLEGYEYLIDSKPALSKIEDLKI